MDALGNIQPVVIQTPQQPQIPAAPVLPQPAQPADTSSQDAGNQPANGQVAFDVKAAEQKRFEAVQRMAQDIANVYVVSDKRFTIFKDATGQYITRFTSLRDGKVTYIPEPQMVRLSGGISPAVLTIKA